MAKSGGREARREKFWVKLGRPGEIQRGVNLLDLSTPPEPSPILGSSNFEGLEKVLSASRAPVLISSSSHVTSFSILMMCLAKYSLISLCLGNGCDIFVLGL